MEESGAEISKLCRIIRISFTSLCFLGTQVLATFCVCFTSVNFGANFAITSAVVFALQKGTDDQMEMSLEEASWLRKKNVLNTLSALSGILNGGYWILGKWGFPGKLVSFR